MSRRNFTLGRFLAVAFAFATLVVVIMAMLIASEGPVELGPYTTGDGDNVVVTPRAAP